MLSLMKHTFITFSFQSLYTLYYAITSGNRASSNTHRNNTTTYNKSSGSNATFDNGINATFNSGSIKFPIVGATQFHTMGTIKQVHVLQNDIMNPCRFLCSYMCLYVLRLTCPVRSCQSWRVFFPIPFMLLTILIWDFGLTITMLNL